MPINSIELELLSEFNNANINKEHQESIISLLRQLKKHHLETYTHSIQVALLSAKIARTLNLDPKPLLFAGCLHDIGKIRITKTILNAKTKTPNYKVLDQHVIYSYEILKSIHPFSAEISLMHHRFQKRKNKSAPPKLNPNLSLSDRKSALRLSRLLAIADHFEAATNRINPRLKRPLTREEALKGIMKEFPKQKEIIEKLKSSGFFESKYILQKRQILRKNPEKLKKASIKSPLLKKQFLHRP